MKYKDKINQFLVEGGEAAFQEWLLAQPKMEQVAIMRELKEVTLEFSQKMNMKIAKDVPFMEDFDKKTDAFEDSILDVKLAEDVMAKVDETMENHIRKMATADYGVREHIINCIINEEPNAAEMRKLAQRMIALEKKENFHNPDKWNGLPKDL